MDVIIFFRIFIYIILLGVPIVALYFLYKQREKTLRLDWEESRKFTTMKILVPRENEKTPIAAEQMFASLHGIYKDGARFQDELSFEIVAKEKFIQFYVHVPEQLKDFIEGQVYAQYPDVEIIEVDDYASEDNFDDLDVVGCELVLNKNEVYPIKTFTSFEVDPLAAITGVLGRVDKNEQIWMQIIVKPVSDDWQNKGISVVSARRSGQSIGGAGIISALFKGIFNVVFDIVGTATGRSGTAEAPAEAPKITLSGPEETALKEVETKITKLGFETKIRILTIAKNVSIARSKNNIVTGVFKQFNTIHSNGFKASGIISDKRIIELYRQRNFSEKGFILNIEELASLFHLPTATVETPHIVWAGSKKGEPPSNLPIEGVVSPDELTSFAKTDFRHVTHKFGIKLVDRRLHMYAIGKTGTGKSTMLENMIIDDISKGRGLAVVDPHGELINHILDFIPANRISDVVYFNPSDKDFPIAFNPLENVDPDLRNIVASGVVGIFHKIFGDSWGPRLEYILRNAILALLEYPDSTLLGVMRILVDKEFRKKVVAKITDPVVKDFFVNEYDKWDQKFRLEAIQSIQNKVGQFLSSSTIRNVVGQPKSSFDIRKIMDEGKILLLDLSIGKIGEDNAALLGAMMITKIQLAAMQRADVSEEKRRDFYLYVDEFQNFATESFAVILSEARKYHLNLIMTNQYIAQMIENVAQAIFGNVGTIISFRVGAQDSTALTSEFAPVFDANDLVNLDNYHVYVKMAIDGVTRPAFSAATLPPFGIKNDNRDKIINASRERYTKDRAFVEEKISEWSKNNESEQAVQQALIDEKIMNNTDEYIEVKDTKDEKWYIKNKADNEPSQEASADNDQNSKANVLISVDDTNEIMKIKNKKDLTLLEPGDSVKIDST
jgi:hypothetical protein